MVDQAEIHLTSLSDAAKQIINNFEEFPDKFLAIGDLNRLTTDKDSDVRSTVAYALAAAFPKISNKNLAWKILHRLTTDKDGFVRMSATDVLGTAFPYVPDKDLAWEDLYRVTTDEDFIVRGYAAKALSTAFSHVSDKDFAWKVLEWLITDEVSFVRIWAVEALGTAFPYVPDKDLALEDLHWFTTEVDRDMREESSSALGSAFSKIPDRNLAFEDLHRLSTDEDRGVRVSANHSLGKASIFKATEAENEEDFKRELENGLEYFERSVAEAEFSDPAKFCLPFYRSFHIIAFKKAYSVTELNWYLNEAKNIAKGSKNRVKLLEIIEHISQAQTEAHSAQEMDLDAMKCYLNIYRKHCKPASDLLRSTEELAPIATKLIRKRTPIFDQDVRETIKSVLDAVEAKHVPESELRGTNMLNKILYHTGL